MSDARVRESGFSLVEVMVAMLILSIGLLGAALMQANISTAALIAKQRSEALALATNRLELKRAEVSAEGAACVASDTEETVNAVTATYTVTTNTVCDGVRYEGVTVTVEWADSDGDENNVELITEF